MSFECQNCDFVSHKNHKKCPNCGWEPEKKIKTKEYFKGVNLFNVVKLTANLCIMLILVLLTMTIKPLLEYDVEVPIFVFIIVILVLALMKVN